MKNEKITGFLATSALLVSGLAVGVGCSFDRDAAPDHNGEGQVVPEFPGAGGESETLPGGEVTCYFGELGEGPAAVIEQVVESSNDGDLVRVRLTLSPFFVDNSFGATAVGWTDNKGHSFDKLVGSDHAQMQLIDQLGQVAFDFKMDYISETPGGYQSGGVWDGDGEVLTGEIGAFVAVETSLGRNLNERGYADYVVDSPATDDLYTANPEALDWDFRVVYEVWVDASAFANGFDHAEIKVVHASPSKTGNNTVEVTPLPCPPDWCNDPDGCEPGAGQPPEDTCTNPDGCDGGNPPGECVEDADCPTGEFCNEGGCYAVIN